MYQSSLRKVLVVFAVGLIAVCCSAPEASEIQFTSEQKLSSTPDFRKGGIRIEFPELSILIADVDTEDFNFALQGRTATIKPRTYGGIDGSKIRIIESQLDRLTARIRFELGALQYLTDDVRASPLDFSHQTVWTVIDIPNNEIQVPQFYKNRENVIEVFRQLGFGNEDEFLRSLEVEYFEKLKAISYRTQKEYFANLLKRDRERYAQCCPEYIKQAEKFLNRTPGEFRTFEDLGVEIYLKRLTLEIGGVDKAGQPLRFSVIGTK